MVTARSARGDASPPAASFVGAFDADSVHEHLELHGLISGVTAAFTRR
jgi:hypothetical protein